jgi:hypothetical protein
MERVSTVFVEAYDWRGGKVESRVLPCGRRSVLESKTV